MTLQLANAIRHLLYQNNGINIYQELAKTWMEEPNKPTDHTSCDWRIAIATWQIRSGYMCNVAQLLQEGWEPFAVTHANDLKDPIVYLRRKEPMRKEPKE